jgi:hypothetical protein
VWCADAACGVKCARFVLGTGGKCAYVVDIGKGRRSYRWFRTPGAVVAICLSRDGRDVVLSTWQRSVLARRSIRGAPKWEKDTDPASLVYLRPLTAPDRMLMVSAPNAAGGDSSYELLDEMGNQLSGGVLSASENAKVFSSPDGNYLCIGGQKLITHKGKSMSERRAVLMNSSGRVIWEKGSLFFQVDPVAVTSEGWAVVGDQKNALFVVGPSGEPRPVVKLPGRIERAVTSRDGSRVLLQCSGHRVCLLSVAK